MGRFLSAKLCIHSLKIPQQDLFDTYLETVLKKQTGTEAFISLICNTFLIFQDFSQTDCIICYRIQRTFHWLKITWGNWNFFKEIKLNEAISAFVFPLQLSGVVPFRVFSVLFCFPSCSCQMLDGSLVPWITFIPSLTLWPAFTSPHIARWHSWPLGIHLICLWIFPISLFLSLHSFLYSTHSSCHFDAIPRGHLLCSCFSIPYLYLGAQVLIKMHS